jgi:N-acetylmuramoyl-L-alanine amidase
MRKFYPLIALLCFVLQGQFSFAQNDSTVKAHINELISKEQNVHLRADSVLKTAAGLQVWFNTDSAFAKGTLSETESEELTELLVHLLADTDSPGLLLLAKDRSTGEYKTLDYFVDAPPVEKYKPVPNNDPYPNVPGNGRAQARVFPGSGQPVGTGALAGKTVWLSPGHGWQNTGTGLGFLTQRGTSNQLVEDFTTAETVDYYLQHYLINAGAHVWSVRERDMNINEIIVNNDNGAPGYTETGSWTDGTIPGYGGTYRTSMAEAAQTATAVFTPAVTVSGLYWVSIRFISGVNRATDVQYAITHAGGTTTFTVNQELHGDTWVYLGQFYFFAGGSYKIMISNQSAESGQAIVADAVRLGGGIGQTPDCLNGGEPSGRPRFEEAARMYARFQGHPPCREDVTVRPIYAEYELSKGEPADSTNAVFVSFHTNAGGGTGTETYRYNGLGSGAPFITPGSTELRDSIHRQVVADIRAGWRSNWVDRGVKTANFGELRPLQHMPGILMELGFHDHTADAADLRNPEFRRLAARAVYKGILKFFHFRDSTPLIFLPEEPVRVAARNIGSANIQLSWAPPVSGGIFGHPATSYRVYISDNGRGFANAINVTDTVYVFKGEADKTYFFKIAAVNAGGESFASGVVAAHTPSGKKWGHQKKASYLLVDGFDRLDASAMLLKNESSALGNVRRMVLERMNSYNYMIEHGNGLASCDLSFDGVQNEVIAAGAIDLSKYFAVDWFVGEESTGNKTLDSTEKLVLKNYLDDGGRLLISGSEIGWDLGRAASPNADLDFYNRYLKAVYVSDGAGTYNFNGSPIFFNGDSGTFGNGFNGSYNVDFPDVVDTVGGSQAVLNYSGGTGGAAGVGYKGNFRVLYFGFPIEAIISDSVRNNLICQSANFLASKDSIFGFVLAGWPSPSGNKLHWITLAEINTAHFIVERSTDGINFQPISGPITAEGDARHGHLYHYIDQEALPVAYYRIKAVDVYGWSSSSNMVIIKNNTCPLFYVLENPVQNNIRVRVSGTESFRLTLSNSQGQVVYQSAMQNMKIRNLEIPATHLSSGVYWLSAHTGKGVQTVKVLVP